MELFNVYPLFDVEPVKGEGTFVFDKNGQRYLDLYGGHAVISIGHSHPHYVANISAQVEKIGFYSNSVQNPLQKELARKLGEACGLPEYSLFLCNSGAEANENALKLASFKTGKSNIISFKNSFHGRTSAAVVVTDNPKIKAPINFRDGVIFLDMNDLAAVEAELKTGNIAGVIIEGIQGIGGIRVPEPEFMIGLRDLCTQYGAVLILDEIQSGYGRSGKFFAFQYTGIKPDLITVAKGMGNGFPIGGVLISPEFEAKSGMLGTTFGGNYLACAAGIAVLDVIKSQKLIANAEESGNFLIAELKKIDAVKEVRGLGLMIGVEFDFNISDLRKKLLYEKKIFTGVSGTNILRLLPPLILRKEHAVMFLDKLKESLVELS
ncbi:MAG TPA: aminotransferase class III-fold pyridoxal phosphate-dependent enzyme [Prolixibacteraceae bacterium]|nr:aspartate aminotransferase family protein [Bacteroidales bacterium]HPB04868.1 aminotransferase class III-fold pyridoxal phosphate-dependent enzyme [Prolixibacteraceae bacterium]HUM88874.1 aminotransferase class III-fold pyridoxal phosphate-dependent enzyme [Prolixibacteraceae bacterium]